MPEVRRFISAIATLAVLTVVYSERADAQSVQFARDVWPIFADRCFGCHGPVKQEGALRLDSPESIRAGSENGPIFVARDLENSVIHQRITLEDWNPEIMPNKGDPLTKDQIETIGSWIEGGPEFDGWTPEMTEEVAKSVEVELPKAAELPPAHLEFNRDIRRILSDNCFKCHGPDRNARKADLRLDVREVALSDRDGRRAIVPGDLGASELARRIFHPVVSERMPPLESEKSLSEDEKKTLAAWIAQGAEYEPHWAYIAPKKSRVPEIRGARGPIDAFIGARLDEEGLKASPEADPLTLLRRLSFDLIGLPPTPDQVNRTLADPSETRYLRTVDGLLGSPFFGERMALDWLDQVRYADTAGYHADNERSVYPYREYVIEAFNANKPYDRFTIEQLAGDLLPDRSRETLVASTYNRLNQTTAEGGAQAKEYLAKYMADKVRTMASVWLGSTIGCAECHDHKFDPFTTENFYSFGAFFADLNEPGIASGTQRYAPYMLLPNEEEAAQLADLAAAIELSTRRTTTPSEEIAQGLKRWEAAILDGVEEILGTWAPATPEAARAKNGTILDPLDDLSVIASGPIPNLEVYEIDLSSDLEAITAIRLEALNHADFDAGITRSKYAFWLTEFEVEVKAAGETEFVSVKIAEAENLKFPDIFANAVTSRIDKAIDGDILTGWLGYAGQKHGDPLVSMYTFAHPIAGGPGTKLRVRLKHLGGAMYYQTMFGRVRLSLTTAPEPELDKEPGVPEFVLRALRSDRPPAAEVEAAIAAYYQTMAPELEETRRELTETLRRQDQLERSVDSTLISEAIEPRTIRILKRGNWQDVSGEIVEAATPSFLPAIKTEGARATRLDLARWLVSEENPLTARVYVNRLWKMFFGAGLSQTLDDLGSQGDWPSHPELLDWLAVEFMESGWDVKHLVRLIVTSNAYRQSSTPRDELNEIDPNNRLLARQNSFRLQAELVRDNALAISGLLSPRIGGRSVKPYQPKGYWGDLYFPARTYVHDEGEKQYRRGLYTHWQRSFLHPSLKAFDAPTREECVAQRSISNTPLQALTLLNDPTYVEAARVFGERILTEGGMTVEDRLNWAFKQALGRGASAEEVRILSQFLERQRRLFDADEESAERLIGIGLAPRYEDIEPSELATWTSLGRAILNLHETITRS